ncbi:universal stress protein [Cupriavidus basilensis]|uniref:Universal stress protein n=1 Tax=Cupriavidus basilensis TaxID=68895 RepID=A0ABT6AHM8_9BURK|nr:universal stress protein [Cupriavidus basilensis]MDF3832109.1 universal stress protein [Cupriavidus basilensis]
MVKLLVFADGSDSALSAVRHAAFLFREGSISEVVLLNVQAPVELGRASAFHSLSALRTIERAEGTRALSRACAILDDSGVNYVPEICVGPTAKTIAHVAEASQCDGILLGTTFWSRFNACFGGGLPARLMRRTRVPVTLIKAAPCVPGASAGTPPYQRGSHASPLLVVYPLGS